jgi:hypothetical protein
MLNIEGLIRTKLQSNPKFWTWSSPALSTAYLRSEPRHPEVGHKKNPEAKKIAKDMDFPNPGIEPAEWLLES